MDTEQVITDILVQDTIDNIVKNSVETAHKNWFVNSLKYLYYVSPLSLLTHYKEHQIALEITKQQLFN